MINSVDKTKFSQNRLAVVVAFCRAGVPRLCRVIHWTKIRDIIAALLQDTRVNDVHNNSITRSPHIRLEYDKKIKLPSSRVFCVLWPPF